MCSRSRPRTALEPHCTLPFVRGDVLAINTRASATEREAALAFLRFMTGADAQHALLLSDLQPALADLPLRDDYPKLLT